MKSVARLSALKVARIVEPGFYADGDGLYLQVGKGGARSWIYRYMLAGKQRDMGVGGLREGSLPEARRRVEEFRSLRSQGIDPIEARRKFRKDAKLAADRSMTFRDCAEAYISAYRPSWRNDKHAAGEIRASIVWRLSGSGNRHSNGVESLRANLDNEERDGDACTRIHTLELTRYTIPEIGRDSN